MVCIGFGAYFGIVFYGHRTKGRVGKPLVKGEPWYHPLARFCIALLITAVLMLPYLLLTSDHISNTYILMIFKTLLPTFIVGFVLFCGLLDHIFEKLRILKFEEYTPDPLDSQVIAMAESRGSILERHAK